MRGRRQVHGANRPIGFAVVVARRFTRPTNKSFTLSDLCKLHVQLLQNVTAASNKRRGLYRADLFDVYGQGLS